MMEIPDSPPLIPVLAADMHSSRLIRKSNDTSGRHGSVDRKIKECQPWGTLIKGHDFN